MDVDRRSAGRCGLLRAEHPAKIHGFDLLCDLSDGKSRGERRRLVKPVLGSEKAKIWQEQALTASDKWKELGKARAPSLLNLEVPYPFIPANTPLGHCPSPLEQWPPQLANRDHPSSRSTVTQRISPPQGSRPRASRTPGSLARPARAKTLCTSAQLVDDASPRGSATAALILASRSQA